MKKIFRYIWSVAALTVALTATSCQENEYGSNQAALDEYHRTHPTVKDSLTYQHPCALYTAADFKRVSQSLGLTPDETGTLSVTAPQAVQDEFNALKNNRYTGADYQNNAHVIELIVRGSNTTYSENFIGANRDAAAAYQFGLLYQLTGDEQYAKWGIYILNAWAAGCTGIYTVPSDCRLAAGVMGFQFSLAAEELRTYKGWSDEDQSIFKTWIKEKFYKLNSEFLLKHNGTTQTCGATHYWSNWDMVNLCSMLQIGILLEDDDIVNEAKEYFLNTGDGNGNINKLCLGFKSDPLGTGECMYQNQESGRDQGHAMMSTAVAIQLCQAAWALYQSNPTVTSLDFFSANDNAILRMGEYVAMSNLRDGTDNYNQNGNFIFTDPNQGWATVGPFCTLHSPQNVVETSFADDSGRGKVRPNWEILYNHFAKVAPETLASGSGYSYAKKTADKMRPEGGPGDDRYGTNSGAFDQIGWGTLMMYRGE